MSGSGPLFIGVDIGTSGVRAVAVDQSVNVLASGQAKLATYSPDHRDPKVWRLAFTDAFQALLRQIDASQVTSISVDGTSGTVLPISADGTPLAEPLMYNDPVQDAGILSAVSRHAPRTSAAHGATSGLAKVLHFQSIANVRHILHQADWLAGELTGRYDLSDENNALKTGYDPVLRCWPDWMDATGVNRALLPDVLPAGAPMARLSAKAAEEFKLPSSVLVVAGTTDGCASFLATGASEPGDGVSALGSTLTIKLLSATPLFAPEYGLYSHRIGDMWLAGGASNTGGIVLAAHFSDVEIARLSAMIDPTKPLGLNYYPLIKPGERFPINDPAYLPRMTPRPDKDSDFLQAILEGIGEIEALAYQRLQGLGAPKLSSVRSVGGGAKNQVWSAIRQQILEVPFPAVASEEAATGTVRLAIAGAKQAGLIA